MAREEKVKKKGSCLKTLLIIFGVFRYYRFCAWWRQ